MTRAYDLYKRYSSDELVAMDKALRDDPANLTPVGPDGKRGGIYIHNKVTRKKFDDISWAITYHLQDKREQEKAK